MKDYESIALHQAETMNEQAERIRELIRERDNALSKAEAAYDMAEQYARKAGHDVARDDVLKYVGQYWEAVGARERHVDSLERFHWDVFRLANQLQDGIASGAADRTPDLAQRVLDRLRAVNPYTGRKSAKDLFPRPQV